MRKRRLFAPKTRRLGALPRAGADAHALSPRGFWVRAAHQLRIGLECALAVGAAAALAWTPAPTLTEFSANAAVATPLPAPPPAPAFVQPAVTADAAVLAAVFAPAAMSRHEVEAHVRRGDTLNDVLARAGVNGAEAHRAFQALRDVFDPRTLRAGQDLTLYVDNAGEGGGARLLGLAFKPDVERTIHIARQADAGYRAREFAVPLTPRIARAQGVITESLYADAKRAGVNDAVIAEIANLLAYAVDFQREIRAGDTFDILFEQLVDPSGHVVKTGDIFQVSFTPGGRDLAYWRYTPPGEDETVGFYDVAGESAQRFLMKTPVNATRISSGFSTARRHPVLGYTRAHKGTDFAAPRGTPIYAAGNGVVERANEYGSFGNYVRIRHANGYKTIYGHLNGFARGVRAGTHVSQGQVIGYVGMTGTATGPHLHYEVHVNGSAVNPMRIEVPTGRKLTEGELPGFQVERALINAMRERAVPADAPPTELMVSAEPTDHAALNAAHTDG